MALESGYAYYAAQERQAIMLDYSIIHHPYTAILLILLLHSLNPMYVLSPKMHL